MATSTVKQSTGTVLTTTLSPLVARALVTAGHASANKTDFTDVSLIAAKDAQYAAATPANRIALGVLEDIRQVPAFYPPF